MRDALRLPPESSTTGGDDVLVELERDHRQVEQLFARASLNVGDERLAVLAGIVDVLTVHAAVEEKVVYPAIEKAVGGGDVLSAGAHADHDAIKQLLSQVAAAKADDDDLVDDLRALQLAVQAHVTVEEGLIFPAYRAVATTKEWTSLTASAKKARAAAGRTRVRS